MRMLFPRFAAGAAAACALAVTSGCGSTQTASPDPSLTELPANDEPRVRDESIEYVEAPETPALPPIHFEVDRYTITRDARIALEDVAVLMKDNPEYVIQLEGHCDERGADEYNLALGENRAQAAKRYLVSLGVDEDRFRTISFGEARPIAFGSDEGSWARNRRAEFRVRIVE